MIVRNGSSWRNVLALLGLAFGLTVGVLLAERRARVRRSTTQRTIPPIDEPLAAADPSDTPLQPRRDDSAPATPPIESIDRVHSERDSLPDVLVDPSIVVRKAAREIVLRSDGAPVARYAIISLGREPLGAKCARSDGRTPEGEYHVCAKGHRDGGEYLKISYPGESDADAALERGAISRRDHRAIITASRAMTPPPEKTALGGGLVIGTEEGGWPEGSVIVSAADIGALEAALPLGATILLEP
ncbi:MAG: hypothetical protein U1E26_09455 [Coriobacteriia bacterium]|nr:hypothetical protein [Coriobacteriia bacterium]